jgi:hypothetical protein
MRTVEARIIQLSITIPLAGSQHEFAFYHFARYIFVLIGPRNRVFSVAVPKGDSVTIRARWSMTRKAAKLAPHMRGRSERRRKT